MVVSRKSQNSFLTCLSQSIELDLIEAVTSFGIAAGIGCFFMSVKMESYSNFFKFIVTFVKLK
jgi:hypothetical protein